jgi:murein DD-endopeptidase MepM/ murein hydrolase activator NlpD
VGRKATAGILLSLFALPSFLGTSIYQYLSAKDHAESSLARAEPSFVHAQTQIDYLDQKSDQFKALYEAQISANHSLTQELEEKKGEILTLGKRVNDVESVLGITQETSVVDCAELSLEQRIDAAAIDSAVRATMFRLLPNDSRVIYQRKNPITGKLHRHLGIDLTCQRGEQVLAPADGVVELRRPSREGYGNLLKLRHAFGFMTSYAHLQSFKVRSGQFVKKAM